VIYQFLGRINRFQTGRIILRSNTCRAGWALALVGMWGLSVWAAPPLFETTLVFPVTPKNKPNYRIPSILQAPNGDVLIICERRNDGPGDIGDHDTVMKRSRDKGKTWSAEQMIFDDGMDTSTDLTLGFDRSNGRIWL